MTKNHGVSTSEGMRETPEYLHAKRMFAKRKELQATLREINHDLRHLQACASAAVTLARIDVDNEMKTSM